MHREIANSINLNGFALVPNVVGESDCLDVVNQFNHEMQSENLRTSRGTVFAARNLIDEFAPALTIWRRPILLNLLQEVLGPQAGLVRVLYFDKPSHRSWSLPWHKDMTIAVKNNSLQTRAFSKPTRKAGVPHFEAPTKVLQNMLTFRLHLDHVTDQNGPLRVVPGSHLTGKSNETNTSDFNVVHARIGDVLAMRPLISHSSGHSDETANMHRRILHFEFCSSPSLPEDVEWHRFVSVASIE